MKKTKKVGFYLDTKPLGEEWSTSINSFPMSGTDKITISTAVECASAGLDVCLYTTSRQNTTIVEKIKSEVVENIYDAYKRAINIGMSYFVFPIRENEGEYKILSLNGENPKIIGWAHNDPTCKWMNAALASKSFEQLICVSNTQAFSLGYHPLFDNIKVIPNFIENNSDVLKLSGKNISNEYCLYVGALAPSKGFHLIADVWPKVHAKFPHYNLVVCGSSKLYAKSEVGNREKELADPTYEKEFMRSLGGNIEHAKSMGVIFLGSVNKKLLDYYIFHANFVLVNPNTKNAVETFCLSAVEALMMRKAVIGGFAGALPETVGHKIGGLLSKSKKDILNNILKLISDSKLREKLGDVGYRQSMNRYEKEKAINRWIQMLNGKKISKFTYFESSTVNTKNFIRLLARYFIPLDLITRLKSVKNPSK